LDSACRYAAAVPAAARPSPLADDSFSTAGAPDPARAGVAAEPAAAAAAPGGLVVVGGGD
jgi:hypothetical protein